MEERHQGKDSVLAKKDIYDSVFTNLFKIPEYTLQLYQALHPEDEDITADQLQIVTLENILLNQPYNDLGVLAGSRFLILVEAQSSWSKNILVRALIYIAQTFHDYILDTNQNIYGSRKVSIPEPEIYVLYTGDREECPEYLDLSQEFFGGRKTSIDVRVKMLYGGKAGDIIQQYVDFTKVYKGQYDIYGRTRKAVTETIRICKDRDILRAYLTSREKEVIDIMMTLFDQEQAMKIYVEEVRREGREEGTLIGKIEAYRDAGFPDAEIAEKLHIPKERLHEIMEENED